MGDRGSLVAKYIEKRGWFPGQSGSQTYGYEGVVTLRQVLGYRGALTLVPTPTAGSEVIAPRKFGSFLNPEHTS